MATKKEWSNEPPPVNVTAGSGEQPTGSYTSSGEVGVAGTTVGQEIENDIAMPTARELQMAVLAEKAKSLKAQSYTVTHKSKGRIRVIHDAMNNRITFGPEETKTKVMLFPHMAEYFNKLDLAVTANAA